MNKEVQEAIEQIRDDVKWNSNEYLVDVVVSYIYKLQKENAELKEQNNYYRNDIEVLKELLGDE